MAPKPKNPIERFIPKITIEDTGYTTPCWLWNAYIDKATGYSRFGIIGKVISGHRWSYEYFIQPIPDNLHIDHLCRTRHCVNPDHLEPVSLTENLLRGDRSHLGRHFKIKTHCPKNHPYNTENTWLNPKTGSRHCRSCNRENIRRLRAK